MTQSYITFDIVVADAADKIIALYTIFLVVYPLNTAENASYANFLAGKLK